MISLDISTLKIFMNFYNKLFVLVEICTRIVMFHSWQEVRQCDGRNTSGKLLPVVQVSQTRGKSTALIVTSASELPWQLDPSCNTHRATATLGQTPLPSKHSCFTFFYANKRLTSPPSHFQICFIKSKDGEDVVPSLLQF